MRNLETKADGRGPQSNLCIAGCCEGSRELFRWGVRIRLWGWNQALARQEGKLRLKTFTGLLFLLHDTTHNPRGGRIAALPARPHLRKRTSIQNFRCAKGRMTRIIWIRRIDWLISVATQSIGYVHQAVGVGLA